MFPLEGGWAAAYDVTAAGPSTTTTRSGQASPLDRTAAASPDSTRTPGPWVRSPHGCVRYVFAVPVGDEIYAHFEYTREDGSHDLRVATGAIG